MDRITEIEKKLENENKSPIKLSVPELVTRDAREFNIELIFKSDAVIFHINERSPTRTDNEYLYKIIPKRIIRALNPIIPKSMRVLITYVPEMLSWAVIIRALAKDPCCRLIATHALKSLENEFSSVNNEVIL